MEGPPIKTCSTASGENTIIKNETPLAIPEEHLNIPVQESLPVTNLPVANQEKLPEKLGTTCNSQEDLQTYEAQRGAPKKEVYAVAPDPSVAPVAESTLLVKPFNCSPSTKKKWQPRSITLGEKFKRLVKEKDYIRVGSLMYINSEDYLIAKESYGTEVFLGLRNDRTKVVIKKVSKCKNKELKNEERFLRVSELDHQSILRYVDAAEDDDFSYIAFQLYEYTLMEYVEHVKYYKDHTYNAKGPVRDMLEGLKALHHNDPPIFHGDIKEENIRIDVKGRAKFTSFSKSRFLFSSQTIYNKRNSEEMESMSELLEDENEIQKKLGFDIQMVGRIIFYILSGKRYICGETLDDLVEMDLTEGMITTDIQKQLTADECLNHAYFWTPQRREEYLRRVGNRKEVQKYKQADPDFISSLEKFDKNGSLKAWKTKFPRELKKTESWKPYSENPLGLLRYYRNLCEHHAEEKVNLMTIFPDLFGCIYKFAQSQGWNSEPLLQDVILFTMEDTRVTPRDKALTKCQEEHLTVSVQESQHSFTRPARNDESDCKVITNSRT